ncbi:MAG: TIGR04084 family radical SAM/SPASM domain-containing protein [Nitrososphaerota archaeon]|nr:TIGR04084 family radical SAM/SPASM domain-containing protein [Candidatus Bathyarchaeota archaeon]MDW8023658.1 TIGR04084 family radical SAM/SPASM domain-containing protein [Nitrososphaerota archaeon]
MFFFLMLTTECNLECRYCFGEALEDFGGDFGGFDVDYSMPKKIDYSVDLLGRFCGFDSGCVLIFYGGEPLLCVDMVKCIMDSVRAEHFILQTNGLLLDRLEPAYVNRFTSILVSLDGDEALTDYYRGRGVYRRVVNNLKRIVRNGFRGEIIARMTVMEQTDIYRQVFWLINNSEFPFSSIHWQLNAGFWNDFSKRNFREWSVKSYNPGVRRLAKFWVDVMEEKGVVLRLYPFLGVADSLLKGETKSLLRCGAGWISYAIQTDGHIIPCPSMWGMRDYYVGHIKDANPVNLRKVDVGEPCTSCKTFNLCGGRCLYANITKRWKAEEYRLVCQTVENLIDAVKKEIPRMKRLIRTGKIRLEDFEFMKYNGCEIIP